MLYNWDDKRIAFILSFFTMGSAAIWASTFHNKVLKASSMGFETLKKFLDEYNKAFVHTDIKVITWLTTTQVTKNLPLCNYIFHF